MKKSAVEWLVKELDLEIRFSNLTSTLKQAKEMEKQYLKKAFEESRKANIFEENKPPLYKDFEQWFKQLKDK